MRKQSNPENQSAESKVEKNNAEIDRKDQNFQTRLYMREFNRYPLLQQPEFNRLHALWQAGNREAYDLMVYSNVRLVLSMANQYRGCGLGEFDMRQEGLCGLMRAVEKFEPERGNTFSTYATWWVRQAITRAIQDRNENKPFRLPVHMSVRMNLVRRERKGFNLKHGRFPDEKELYKWIHRFDGTDKGTKLAEAISISDIEKCGNLLAQSYTSLDSPVRDENKTTFGEVIPDTRDSVEVIAKARSEHKALAARLEMGLKHLNAQQAKVVRLRFGSKPMTLEEVGEQMDLTRERIRQIQVNALQKLKRVLKITPEEVEEIIDACAGLKELSENDSEFVGSERVNNEPRPPPIKPSPESIFYLLCEHVLLMPTGLRIIKAPLQVLKARMSLDQEVSRSVLEELRSLELIDGQEPWNVVRVIPNVQIPTYGEVVDLEDVSELPTIEKPAWQVAPLPRSFSAVIAETVESKSSGGVEVELTTNNPEIDSVDMLKEAEPEQVGLLVLESKQTDQVNGSEIKASDADNNSPEDRTVEISHTSKLERQPRRKQKVGKKTRGRKVRMVGRLKEKNPNARLPRVDKGLIASFQRQLIMDINKFVKEIVSLTIQTTRLRFKGWVKRG